MLLALPDSAAPGERGQKDLVHAQIERRELEPFLDVPNRFIIGNALREMLQEGGVTGAESSPLSSEPPVEDRVAVDFQPLQKLAVEQRGERLLPLRSKPLHALLGRAGDLDRIDETVRQVEPDSVVVSMDAPALTPVNDASDLAQAPPELSARIVRNIPQQFAELASRHRARGKGQIGEERAHFAGCRQRQRAAGPRDRHGPEHPYLDGRLPAGPRRFHAGYHASPHASKVLSGSNVTARAASPASTSPASRTHGETSP